MRELGWDPLKKGKATPPVFLPGRSHGEGSLVGYSPQSHKRVDSVTKQQQQKMAGKNKKTENPKSYQHHSKHITTVIVSSKDLVLCH